MRRVEYKDYLLGVLLIGMAFNYLDRIALGLLLQDIKVDLALSDTQLGVLSGIAFAIFYSIMGIPIARWADRGNRVTIVVAAVFISGLSVAVCGLAVSFVWLLLIRIVVGVGEAGFVPPALSLISSYFNRAERPRAFGIFKLGVPVSLIIGYLLVGWLNQVHGWRLTFALIGLPPLALAVLIRLTVKDPRFAGAAAHSGLEAGFPSRTPSLSEVVRTLRRNATYCRLLAFYSVGSIFGWGIANWQPAFFKRSHGWETAEIGLWMSIVWGVGGLIGTYLGGHLATKYLAEREDTQLKLMAVANCCFGAFMCAAYLASGPYLALALMGIALVGGATGNGPTFAALQSLVPERMRAMAMAVVFLFSNLIGLGFGPLAAGALSDALEPRFGDESLRYALMALCPGYLWCAWQLWRGSQTVRSDLLAAQADIAADAAAAGGARTEPWVLKRG